MKKEGKKERKPVVKKEGERIERMGKIVVVKGRKRRTKKLSKKEGREKERK